MCVYKFVYLCLCVREWEGLCIKDLYVGAWVEDFCVVHIFCMIQNFCVVYKWVLVLLSNFWSGHKVSIRERIFTVNWLNVPGLILVCIQSIWNDFCEKKFFFSFFFSLSFLFLFVFKFTLYFLLHSCGNIMCGLWREFKFFELVRRFVSGPSKTYLFLETFHLIIDLELSLLLFMLMLQNFGL